jgi:hypothetical protein
MPSKFIGADNLVLYDMYSRKDTGFGNTRLALMNINECEKIAFFSIGCKYANKLTEKGFILNPRDDLNNDPLILELRKCTTYIFLRNGNICIFQSNMNSKCETLERKCDLFEH